MALLKTVTIETSITPPVLVYGGAAHNPLVTFLLKILKPKVVVDSAIGETVQAPYGEPDTKLRPLLWVGLAVLLLGVIWR